MKEKAIWIAIWLLALLNVLIVSVLLNQKENSTKLWYIYDKYQQTDLKCNK